MGAAAGPAAIGLQVAGSIMSAIQEQRAYGAAARMDRYNAHSELLQGALNEEDLRRRGRAVQGEAMSALAADGGSVEGGSARDLIYQNALEIEYAAKTARYTAAEKALPYSFRSTQEKLAGKNALIGGLMRAGAQALSGMSGQANSAALQNAYFPGGQSLPMPPPAPGYSTPPYAGGHGPA